MLILQINFKLNVPAVEYQRICDSVAQTIADVPGLVWKIWLLNERDGEAGGIYLFQDELSLAAYLSGPIIHQIQSLPQLRDISAKWFAPTAEVTAITRGPIPAPITT